MKLVYYKGYTKNGKQVSNFGDDLNRWLWGEVLPGVWNADDGISFVGIGTLLESRFLSGDGPWIVFGSGAGYGRVPPGFGGTNWSVVSVRGPITAQVLGVSPDLAVTDPAILLTTLDRFKGAGQTKDEIVFMPHHEHVKTGHWKDVCELAGFGFISPEDESEATVDKIRAAKLVIAEAMHAAIVADAFRVPWVPVSTSCHVNTFKWLDWTKGMGLSYQPILIPPSSLLEAFLGYSLGICGEDFRVFPATSEAAVADYFIRKRIQSLPFWKTYHHLSKKALLRLPQALYRHDSLEALRSYDKRRCLEPAAKALQKAARGVQYLSNEAMFRFRVEQTCERLQQLPNLIDTWRSVRQRVPF